MATKMNPTRLDPGRAQAIEDDYFRSQAVERDLMCIGSEGVYATIIADMTLRDPQSGMADRFGDVPDDLADGS